jgi:hypothetical protein
MALGVHDQPVGRVVWKTALLTLGTLGFVFFLTLLYRSMRSVMDVGGFCAEGGPYEIRQHCPQGVAWIVPVSIFGMIASVGVGLLGVFRQGGPRPYVFAWSALFLALGWNFLEYGFDPPGGGTSGGWLVCGVVFVIMGGAPLFALRDPPAAKWAFGGPPDGAPTTSPWRPPRRGEDAPLRLPLRAFGGLTPLRELLAEPADNPATQARVANVGPDSPPDAADGADVVARLERLAALHDRGAIDDAEYETAKDTVLRAEQEEKN